MKMSNKVNNQATTVTLVGMDSEDISISPHKKPCRTPPPPVVSPLHCSCSEPTSIAFSSEYPRSIKMIEVNDELLQVLLNQKRHAAYTPPSLCIKGDPFLRSEAVLCSGDKTYGLKRVETSNSLFSVPPFATTACITSICSDYYELKEMTGRTDTLRSLLGTPYPPGYAATCRGTGGRIDDPQQQQLSSYGTSKEEIEAMVPASAAEIEAALHQLGAVEIEGKLRVLSKAALFDATKALLQGMVALDLYWAEDGLLVSEDEGRRLLSSGGVADSISSSSIVDPHVLRGCLDLLGSCTVEPDPRTTRTWRLDTLEVSRVTAHLVLQEEEEEEEEEEEGQHQQRRRRRGSTSCTVDVSIAGRDRCSYRCRVMAANDFQFEWSMRTPSKAVTDCGGSPQLLYGLAVLSTFKRSLMQGTFSGSGSSIAVDEPCYFYLPTKRPISSTDDDQLDELPRDPKLLFGLLFAVKDSYTYLELEPYLQLLVRSSGGGAAALSLLGAHTRKTSTADNIITYSAKS